MPTYKFKAFSRLFNLKQKVVSRAHPKTFSVMSSVKKHHQQRNQHKVHQNIFSWLCHFYSQPSFFEDKQNKMISSKSISTVTLSLGSTILQGFRDKPGYNTNIWTN